MISVIGQIEHCENIVYRCETVWCERKANKRNGLGWDMFINSLCEHFKTYTYMRALGAFT